MRVFFRVRCISSLLCFIVIILNSFIWSCTIWGRARQPQVSRDPIAIQGFNKNTVFPFEADKARRNELVSKVDGIHKGLKGDEVMEKIGPPDEAVTLADPGGPAWAYVWQYHLIKRFARAPDAKDKYIEIYFDKRGIVDEVKTQF